MSTEPKQSEKSLGELAAEQIGLRQVMWTQKEIAQIIDQLDSQRSQGREWNATEPDDDGMYGLDTGKHVLQMVSEDYQVVCDIRDAHNASLR